MNRLVVLLALLLMVVGVSSAYAIEWDDHTGPVTFKFSGFSNGTIYDGSETSFDDVEDAWGVGRVTTIVPGLSGSATPLWAYDLSSTEEITYYYHDIVDYSFTNTPGQLLSYGGVFDFYVNPAGTADFLASNRNSGGQAFDTITGGTKLARLLLVPGIIPSDNTTTIQQTLFPVNGGVIGDGTALAAVDLTGDWNTAWASVLDSNYFTNGTDVTLGFTVSPNSSVNNGFMLMHDDPANAMVTPEPVSATLFLFGGISLLARLRRKTKVS